MVALAEAGTFLQKCCCRVWGARAALGPTEKTLIMNGVKVGHPAVFLSLRAASLSALWS